MIAKLVSIVTVLLFALAGSRTHAFTPALIQVKSVTVTCRSKTHCRTIASSSTTTSLSMGRRWNFNESRGPFGLKKNAEIWNGRVAQMGFVIVLLQELVTGKGVITGLQEGNPFNVAMAGATFAAIAGLTVFLAIKGKEEGLKVPPQLD